jgi:putative hydrolase
MASLARLETALALVEGWVGVIVQRAVADRLPSVGRLAEAYRRRRAAGGPAEQTFAALVGLDLRPRRLREATTLWAALTEHRGIDGRDALWGHPDLLPSEEDFADPGTFARSQLDLGDLGDLGDLS